MQIEGYTLMRCDNPHNVSLGGVCVYYKGHLPITIKPHFFMHFCPGTITTHAESINSDLQRGLDRRLRHTQH